MLGIIIIIAIILIVVVVFIHLYNQLVQARNKVKNAWAQIDVQLTRRADLIPNLVETVKGYATHENQTFNQVTEARSAMQNASTVKEAATANNMINTVNDTMSNATSSVSGLDYGSIGEGHTVFTNAYDAASNAHGVISNEWFSNNPLDVFNTATNSYMGLSPEQLNDPTFMAELAKDPNNALLFGDSMASPSGFVGLDDIISEITKGGMMR